MEIHSFNALEIAFISALCEIFQKLLTLESLHFPYFSLIMEIHISHVLGIVWICASSELYKKPIGMLVFSHTFPFLSPYLTHLV